jgi:cell division protein ZapA
MSNDKIVPINLRILDKDYVVACPEEERDTLLASARYLNQKLQEVREGGKVVSTERLVVVSALNIIHEYFQYKQQQEENNRQLDAQINGVQNKIKLALSTIKS